MSDTEEINAEDQAEESLEAPAEENTEELAQEEEENEEAPVENETELVDAEDEGKGDGDVEVNQALHLTSKHSHKNRTTQIGLIGTFSHCQLVKSYLSGSVGFLLQNFGRWR